VLGESGGTRQVPFESQAREERPCIGSGHVLDLGSTPAPPWICLERVLLQHYPSISLLTGRLIRETLPIATHAGDGSDSAPYRLHAATSRSKKGGETWPL
jgi:hypothetical protein